MALITSDPIPSKPGHWHWGILLTVALAVVGYATLEVAKSPFQEGGGTRLSFDFNSSKAAGFASLALSPATGGVGLNQNITVNVVLNTAGAPIDGVDLYMLRFNAAVLQVVDANTTLPGVQIQPGSLLPNTVINTVDNNLGTIQFSQSTTGGSNFTGTGTLATITFRGQSSGTSQVTFDHVVDRTSDTNVAYQGVDQLLTVTNGSYTIDTIAPNVSITGPTGQVSGTTNITANASDNVAVVGVQFRVDGQNVGAEDTSSPYSVSWNTATVSNGSHTLTAVARDAAGNTATSFGTSVTVNNADQTPPTVSITSPGNGSSVSNSITITATASDNIGVAGVQFRVDGQNVGVEDTTSPYSVAWNTTAISNGSHQITAVARDAANNTTTSAVVQVTVNNADTTAPTVSISSPSAGASINGTVTISASASDNIGVAGVQFRVDGQNVGSEDTSSPFSISWNTTTVANGQRSITAVARDAANNSTTSSVVNVTVNNPDTTPPVVSLTTPASGSTVNGTVTITAAASDNIGVAGVQFRVDGQNLGGEDNTAPFTASWNTTTFSNGSHTLTAVARDAAGNTTTSNTASVTVSNQAPNVLPQGNLDEVNTAGLIRGWSFDPDSSSLSNQVQIYIDGPAGTGSLIGTISANIDRPDIRSAFGISGNHGFSLPVPANYMDGRYHSVHAYAIDFNTSSLTQVLTNVPLNFVTKRLVLDPEAWTSKVMSGTLSVLNSQRTQLTTMPFTSDSSGGFNVTLTVPASQVFFKIVAAPFLTRVYSYDLNQTASSVAIPQLLIGDINQDNIINSIDYSILNINWFSNATSPDLNKDGIVNSIDYSYMNRHWLNTGEQ